MTQTVLILGSSGKIGSRAAIAFEQAGWLVRKYDRSAGNMREAARGVEVILNGLNPPMYHDWKTIIPKITAQVIEAAKVSGATVILPGNIYNFGEVTGEINENTPHRPTSRKGAIRVAMERQYRDAGVPTINLRAGNFIDPDGNGDVMSELLLRNFPKVTAPGAPDAKQAFAYTPDWAKAAVMLAEMRDDLSKFEEVPFPGHTFTYNQLRDRVNALTGRTDKMKAFPWWAMRLAAPFVEVARELLEMRYQYSMSHWMGSEKFDQLLPDFKPTPLETVIATSLKNQK